MANRVVGPQRVPRASGSPFSVSSCTARSEFSFRTLEEETVALRKKLGITAGTVAEDRSLFQQTLSAGDSEPSILARSEPRPPSRDITTRVRCVACRTLSADSVILL